MPLCDSRTTACAPFPRLVDDFLEAFSWIRTSNRRRIARVAIGLRIRLPDDRDGTPFTERIAYAETRVAEVGGSHILREDRSWPAKSVVTISFTRSRTQVKSQSRHHVAPRACRRRPCPGLRHSAVADPCPVSPPSSRSACGLDAFIA